MLSHSGSASRTSRDVEIHIEDAAVVANYGVSGCYGCMMGFTELQQEVTQSFQLHQETHKSPPIPPSTVIDCNHYKSGRE